MSLYEDRRDRKAPLDAKPAVPRPWAAMFVTWTSLLDSLCAIVGAHAGVPMIAEASAAVWRWMWSLPPCSEARKAAFTLGAAAMLIERWRKNTDPAADDDRGPCARDRSASNGQRAEVLLNIAKWHIDDARAEALIRARDGGERTTPPHERVYGAGPEAPKDRRMRINEIGWPAAKCQPEDVSRTILGDHFEHRKGSIKITPSELGEAFTSLAIASLPDGPWVMTTQDVDRFLQFILEDLR